MQSITSNIKQPNPKENRTELLKIFLSDGPSQDNEITECMTNIFKPRNPIKDDRDNIEDDKRYLIPDKKSSEKKIIFKTSPKLSPEKYDILNQNPKENKIFLDFKEDLSNNITKENSDSEKYKFISKKRNNSDTFDSKADISLMGPPTKNQNLNQQKKISDIDMDESQNFPKIQYRLDSFKKAIKVAAFKYLTNKLKDLLENSELKGNNIFKPNSISFTANIREEDNLKFLTMNIKEIYCYIEDEKKLKVLV